MVCHLFVDLDWDQSLNKAVAAETGTPECTQTVVLGEPAQNRHRHSWAQDGSASAPPSQLRHSWVVLKDKDTRNSNSKFFRSFR